MKSTEESNSAGKDRLAPFPKATESLSFQIRPAIPSRLVGVHSSPALTYRSKSGSLTSLPKAPTLDVGRRVDTISVVDLTREEYSERDDDGDELPFVRHRKARRLDYEASTSPHVDEDPRRPAISFPQGPSDLTLNDTLGRSTQKRGRGRPRKQPVLEKVVSPSASLPKRGRGRPRKNPVPSYELAEDLLSVQKQPQLSPSEAARIGDVYGIKSNRWMEDHNASNFVQQLLQLLGPPVTISNDVDDSGPPLDFGFIEQNVFGNGTVEPDPEARSGCTCRPENGRSIGCEYRYCSCLEDVATNDEGKPVGFPYYAVGERKGCLRNLYLQERFAIYECNELCSCPANCRTKLVQKGRQIPLEIFKTTDRGWGLRSPVPIRKGQFIDTYRGEIITDEEASRREALALDNDALEKTKDFYLFSLDKFRGTEGLYGFIPDEDLYVIDGQFMGGPTRFINHSCAPNLRQFTVSFCRGNPKVYELAFFAIEDIESYTELTFDYKDLDAEDSDDQEHESEAAAPKSSITEKGVAATKCLCGAPNCRGYLW